MLPKPSRWLIRAALVWFVVGATVGGVLLAAKGVGMFPAVVRLLPGHADMVLVGWTLQMAIGVGWSAFPRRGGRRGPAWVAVAIVVLLNSGVVCVAAAPFLGAPWHVVGRSAEAAATLLFAAVAWPRIRPPGRTAAVAALALVVASAATPATATVIRATAPTVAEEATEYNSQRKVAVAPDGRVAAAFVTGDGAHTGVTVAVARRARAEWEALPTLSRAPAFRPCLAFDARGRLHVAWTELAGEHRQVFYARWEGGGEWAGRTQLSDTPGYSGYPALAVDSGDRVHLVWYGFDGAQYQVYYRRLERDGVWSPTGQITRQVGDANAPSIAAAPDGTLHVVFFTFLEGRHDVYYTSGRAEHWALPHTVNPHAVEASQPSLTVARDGTPRVAYTAGTGSRSWVGYAERRAQGWTLPEQAAPPGTGAPSLAAALDGRPLVAFESVLGEVAWSERTPAGWTAPRALGHGRWPSASWAAYPPGLALTLVVWTAAEGRRFTLGSSAVAGDGPGADAAHAPRAPAAALAVALALAAGLAAFVLLRGR